jgi:hypothetical protein
LNISIDSQLPQIFPQAYKASRDHARWCEEKQDELTIAHHHLVQKIREASQLETELQTFHPDEFPEHPIYDQWRNRLAPALAAERKRVASRLAELKEKQNERQHVLRGLCGRKLAKSAYQRAKEQVMRETTFLEQRALHARKPYSRKPSWRRNRQKNCHCCTEV